MNGPTEHVALLHWAWSGGASLLAYWPASLHSWASLCIGSNQAAAATSEQIGEITHWGETNSLEQMSFSSSRQDRDCSDSTAGGSEGQRRLIHGAGHLVWRRSERPEGAHHVQDRQRWQRRNRLGRRRYSYSRNPIKEGIKKATYANGWLTGTNCLIQNRIKNSSSINDSLSQIKQGPCTKGIKHRTMLLMRR